MARGHVTLIMACGHVTLIMACGHVTSVRCSPPEVEADKINLPRFERETLQIQVENITTRHASERFNSHVRIQSSGV